MVWMHWLCTRPPHPSPGMSASCKGKTLPPLNKSPSSVPPPTPAPTKLPPISVNWTPLSTSVKRSHDSLLWNWPISLSTMFSEFLRVAPSITVSFLFKAEGYSVVCVLHTLLIHSLSPGQLGCSHNLAVVRNAAVSTDTQISLWDLLSTGLGVYPEGELWVMW